ncbi:alcohol dehydrogenase [Stereum hirsutum FP-91666 SS1]|uniref:alcohol dehydrogenase n=1 Tax=Stereum hirsutum (strain FP-91666) TaxID=721885 RepID=UPI000440B4AA|nr:alcohol dehydrogenase [Stereum hirsutum FP-91666 SS1]EIM90773.1 alcohol dehydrogenase [Stereum hirsutum FP-91666 SS1]
MSSPSEYKRIVLAERPVGDIDAKTFRREQVSLSELKPGAHQVLVKVNWLSIDAAMRGWLKDVRSYVPPVQIGETMRSSGLATVVEVGEGCDLVKGDIVACTPGWTEYARVSDKDARKIQIPPGAQALDFLGPLGFTGMTAYFGLYDVGRIQPGETLVVSGAAGATGTLVCQMGKRKGAKVIAIAGSAEKCEWLEKDLGVDKAINYKSPTFFDDFKKHVGFLDVFFDNVGGDILNFALTRLNKGARIALCGAISDYNAEKPKGLSAYMNLISQRATLQGFIVFDYAARYPEAVKEISSWLADGSLKRKYQIVEGLDKAPEAMSMLYSGGNTGKLVVHVDGLTGARL